jgi:hypothetical protein
MWNLKKLNRSRIVVTRGWEEEGDIEEILVKESKISVGRNKFRRSILHYYN